MGPGEWTAQRERQPTRYFPRLFSLHRAQTAHRVDTTHEGLRNAENMKAKKPCRPYGICAVSY